MAEKYIYNGPVMKFDTCVQNRWFAETYAISPEKARSNLAFRFKKENGLAKTAKITLPGAIVKASQIGTVSKVTYRDYFEVQNG